LKGILEKIIGRKKKFASIKKRGRTDKGKRGETKCVSVTS